MAGRHKQLDIDWPRYRQLAVLRDARLSMELKAVLRGLDDFGRGGEAWPSQERLAEVVGCSSRTIRRHLATLERMSLVCRERRKLHDGRGGANCIYTIVWTELALLVDPPQQPDQPDRAGHLVARDLPDNHDDLPDNHDDLPDSVVRFSRSATEALTETQIHPPPPVARATKAAAEDVFGSARGSAIVERDAATAGDWQAIEQRLAAVPVDHAAEAAREARRRGLSPAEVAAVLDEYAANARLFRSSGAIVHRLRSGIWPAKGVISIEEQARRRAAEQARRRAEGEQASRAREHAQQRQAALEAKHGARLDAMAFDEQLALLAAHNEFAAGLMRQNPAADYRRQLLEALDHA